MCTLDVAGFLTLFMEPASVRPPTALGYILVATRWILFGMGSYLLLLSRSTEQKSVKSKIR